MIIRMIILIVSIFPLCITLQANELGAELRFSQPIDQMLKENILDKPKFIKEKNSDIKLEEINGELKKELIVKALMSRDVNNILLENNFIPLIENMYAYNIQINDYIKFPIVIIPLKDTTYKILYVPQTKLENNIYVKSFAKLSIINSKDRFDNMLLISENGYMFSQLKKSSRNELSCRPCITLPNGFHTGEEKGPVIDTDWNCVAGKQARCAAQCAIPCAIATAPACLACIGSCESVAVYDCSTTKEGCLSCDDAPLPGDFRIK